MYVVFVKVQIKPARADEAVAALRAEIIPQVEAAPGFVKGIWFGDDSSGHSVMLFESEEQARQMAPMVSAAPDDSISIEEVKVYQLHAEA